jgi:hypothetical protein
MNGTIQTLWIGSTLSQVERLCLHSFLKMATMFICLHTKMFKVYRMV